MTACNGSAQTSAPANSIYFDNFSNAASGWTRTQNETGLSDYAKGYFHIQVNTKSSQIIANPGKTFDGDISIEVDARKLDGSDDNYIGVICRYQDPDNYYLFMITSDGYTAIAMRKAGVDSLISPALKFLKIDGIKSGKRTNHLRVDCIGEKLVLYANGKQINQAYDSSITGKGVGLAVRSSKLEGGSDISFDNFTVFPVAQP
jgi:hypothetical protein